jgi:hypothetical protein
MKKLPASTAVLLVAATVLLSAMLLRAENSSTNPRGNSAADSVLQPELARADAATLRAAAETADAEHREPVIVSRAADSRVWRRTTYDPVPGIGLVPRHHEYTELATGLHYRDAQGEWQESQAEIELLPNGKGATAQHGRHKVIFPADLHDGAIELYTQEQQWLRSRVLGLSYFDSESGKSVMLAELKQATGELHAPNQVIYADAFTDLRADVRYTYTLAGFEQDIILREQPASPTAYGLNPETTRLQVLTEFFDAPQPKQTVRENKESRDEELDFGGLRMVRGKAFTLGDEKVTTQQIRVSKSWQRMEGRDFLVEEVPVAKLAKQLEALPVAQLKIKNSKFKSAAARILPAPRLVKNDSEQIFRVASPAAKQPGFVMDYVAVATSKTNFTFQGDSTYYLTAPILLNGTTVFEGGTVLKFSTNGSIATDLVDCKTGSYLPVVLTAKDDNRVGEVVSGSTGNPVGYYGRYWRCYNDTQLSNIRVCFMDVAFDDWEWPLDLQNVQVLDSRVFVTEEGNCNVHVFNVLVARCASLIATADDATFNGAHLTVFRCSNLRAGGTNNSVRLTNSLLANVTNFNFLTGDVTNQASQTTVALTNVASVFQTVVGGSFYLATNTYRGLGVTNINPDLLAQLRQKTTYAPIAFTNVTFTSNVVFNIRAIRDTSAAPDLGYHYDPLDYLFAQAECQSNITFGAGTAVGWFRTTTGYIHAGFGLFLTNQQVAAFNGRADAKTVFTRSHTVQESGNGIQAGLGGIIGWGGHDFEDSSIVRPVFTLVTSLAGGDSHFTREDYLGGDSGGHLVVEARHCEFYNSAMGIYATAIALTNCLLHRCEVKTSGNYFPILSLTVRNCTMYGGRLEVFHDNGPVDWDAYYNGDDPDWATSQWPVNIHNTAFDGTSINTDEPGDATAADYDYNAFLSGYDQTVVDGGNSLTTLTNFNWLTGSLGNFYQHCDGELEDRGDAWATNYALNYFTIENDGDFESDSTVDIAYHYPMVDLGGHFLDADGDGLLDDPEATNRLVSVSWQADAAEPTTNGGYAVGRFEISLPSGTLTNDLTVYFKATGSATFGTDYTLTNDFGSNLIDRVVIPAGYSSVQVHVVPNPTVDYDIEFDESIRMRLLPGAAYVVDHGREMLWLRDNYFTNVFTELWASELYPPPSSCSKFPGVTGIDYSPTLNSLLVAGYYISGTPFNFFRVGKDALGSLVIDRWSGVSNVTGEVKIGIVQSSLAGQITNSAGFTNGDVFFSSELDVGQVAGTNGSVFNKNWATLADGLVTNDKHLRGGLYVDQTGLFENKLIVVAGDFANTPSYYGVWKVSASGLSTVLLTNLYVTHLEGVITLPPNDSRYGPWSGKILTGDENQKTLYAISPDGRTATFAAGEIATYSAFAYSRQGIGAEDFDLIKTNQSLYACDEDDGKIYKLSSALLGGRVGDVVITQGDGGDFSALFFLHWNATNCEFDVRAVPCGTSSTKLEHITSAPLDLPSHSF